MTDVQQAVNAAQRAGLLERATAEYRLGRYGEAERLYGQLLDANPSDFESLHRLGVLKLGQGRYEEAHHLLRTAVATDPGSAAALSNLGSVLLAMGKPEEALACYDAAIACQPDDADYQFNRGNSLLQLERYPEALPIFEGLAKKSPQDPGILSRYAVTLKKLECHDKALATYDQAISVAPSDASLHINRSNVLRALRRFEEALASCDRAIALAPNDADCHHRRGTSFGDLNRLEEALAAYEAAIAIAPDHIPSLYNRSNVLLELKRYDEAVAGYSEVLTKRPGHSAALALCTHAAALSCNWSQVALLDAQLRANIDNGHYDGECFCLLSAFDDPALQRKAAEGYVSKKSHRSANPIYARSGRTREQLRVGYLSADFRAHAVAFLIGGLIEVHDRSFCEVHGFSAAVGDGSPMRKRLEKAFDRLIDVSMLSDDALCREVRNAGIDILVDLGGYTKNTRILALAGRPAPVQISYLGYPGTSGAPFIDYIIADKFVIPEGSDNLYTEKIVYLPDCFQVNDRRRLIAPYIPSRAECGLPAHGLVLCAYHQAYKLNQTVFDTWMRVLVAIPGSVLWLVAEMAARENLRQQARARNVDPARLVFAGPERYPDHLARQKLADLFLDAWPYNGGTTVNDALWVGLPVVTLAGRSYAARMAGSLLQAVGLPELITHSAAEYEELVLRLARQPELLERVRKKLAANLRTAPLFDTDRFRKHLEAAYREMWDQHMRGEQPASIAIDPIS